VLAVAGFGCGRDRPGDLPAIGTDAAGETGAFEDVGGGGATFRVVVTAATQPLLTAAAKGYATEDPTLRIVRQEADAKAAVAAVCAGKADAAVAESGGTCGGAKAASVDFHVANADGTPVRLYVTRKALLRFEVEGFVQYVIDNGETLPGSAGLEPLSIDELQETQTVLEQVIAGVR
jgi:hypothetical protein